MMVESHNIAHELYADDKCEQGITCIKKELLLRMANHPASDKVIGFPEYHVNTVGNIQVI